MILFDALGNSKLLFRLNTWKGFEKGICAGWYRYCNR
jgi:hypothetical protein